ncbi:unnamed protein product [Adineta steineri]|uniref:F-box domain-containing protein n=1 Tax=Adineta steineri TaxID=433720 RepID=A0A813PK95_9BILA|nr:unnamed protein product [Adineta steineri]CAF1406578.1 unnamed protein product [Adineta steineri]
MHNDNTKAVYGVFSDMSKPSSCINNILPPEILQKIFLLSAESLHDALHISTTCQLWRKLIFNPFFIEHYWIFDDKHRKKGLIRWWNFNENIPDQNNPFRNCSITNCFLGKCANFRDDSEITEEEVPKNTIDRGSDYTIAFWLLIPEIGDEPRCIFMVRDDDWDYTRSAGVAIDETNFLSIVFASTISERIIQSNVQMKPDQWYHIVLVQECIPGDEKPQQHLWINGKLELTEKVPIAAFSSTAEVCFFFSILWNHSIADVSYWSRRLLPLEIRAIYEQKTSIDKVNMAKYIFEHLNS